MRGAVGGALEQVGRHVDHQLERVQLRLVALCKLVVALRDPRHPRANLELECAHGGTLLWQQPDILQHWRRRVRERRRGREGELERGGLVVGRVRVASSQSLALAAGGALRGRRGRALAASARGGRRRLLGAAGAAGARLGRGGLSARVLGAGHVARHLASVPRVVLLRRLDPRRPRRLVHRLPRRAERLARLGHLHAGVGVRLALLHRPEHVRRERPLRRVRVLLRLLLLWLGRSALAARLLCKRLLPRLALRRRL
mmetsp:Transcript_19410/g.65489  ORF Transcript_19410/g.65489 Transcript_19410/m.65489 type:complete len:257 (-) Transcript_19410:381-1151(-)